MNTTKILRSWAENDNITPLSYQYAGFFIDLEPNIDHGALLLAVLTVESVQNGHVCLKLDPESIRKSFKSGFLDKYSEKELTEWISDLASADLIGKSGMKPLIIENDRLYLHKYWVYENFIAKDLLKRAEKYHLPDEADKKALTDLFHNEDSLNDEQRISIILSLIKDLVFISGGPGTGKTYTVLKILDALRRSSNEELNVALCAPTGKAARRLFESIGKTDNIDLKSSAEKNEAVIQALTIHKLLGADRFGSNFRYNEDKQLPHDVIIVDEASMLDVRMWNNLLKAIPLTTKLILLGDKDQLASVEAGSLLGDICQGSEEFSDIITSTINYWISKPIYPGNNVTNIMDSVVFLKKTYRFSGDSGINKISESIKKGDLNNVFKTMNNKEITDVKWVSDIALIIEEIIKEFGVEHHKFIKITKDYFEISKQKRILCAVRNGFFGVAQLNDTIENRIKLTQGVSENKVWYDGRIILSTKNDNMTGIRNGDLGICLSNEQNFYVTFENQTEQQIPVQRLSSYEAAYAITIHKSQGSEFDDVAIILPEKSKYNHISRELLYTAVTRAKRSVLIVGDRETITRAIENPVTRNSGLSEKLMLN